MENGNDGEVNMSLFNRIANSNNRFQGDYKRVLCVCSAGLLRSPTTAVVLSQEPYNYNTRAAGLVPDFALVPVDEVLLEWAQEIVCMTKEQERELKFKTKKPIVCLDIPDNFAYRDPELMKMIAERYNSHQMTQMLDKHEKEIVEDETK